jgi:hypothetical protein
MGELGQYLSTCSRREIEQITVRFVDTSSVDALRSVAEVGRWCSQAWAELLPDSLRPVIHLEVVFSDAQQALEEAAVFGELCDCRLLVHANRSQGESAESLETAQMDAVRVLSDDGYAVVAIVRADSKDVCGVVGRFISAGCVGVELVWGQCATDELEDVPAMAESIAGRFCENLHHSEPWRSILIRALTPGFMLNGLQEREMILELEGSGAWTSPDGVPRPTNSIGEIFDTLREPVDEVIVRLARDDAAWLGVPQCTKCAFRPLCGRFLTPTVRRLAAAGRSGDAVAAANAECKVRLSTFRLLVAEMVEQYRNGAGPREPGARASLRVENGQDHISSGL